MPDISSTRPDDWFDTAVLMGRDRLTFDTWKADQQERLLDAAMVVRVVCDMAGRVSKDRRAADKRLANRVLGVLTSALSRWWLAEGGGPSFGGGNSSMDSSTELGGTPQKIWKNDLPSPTPEQTRNAAGLVWETWLPTWVESLERELRVGVTVALVAGDSKSAWLAMNRMLPEVDSARKLCAEVLETS